MSRRFTLPTDSNARKHIPLFSGCYAYFPAALAGVAFHSKKGNDKHNPGQELHHARGKSNDHADCIARHLADLHDLIALSERIPFVVSEREILDEVDALSWRALALSQELHEKFGAPLAPAARLPGSPPVKTPREIDNYIAQVNTGWQGPLADEDGPGEEDGPWAEGYETRIARDAGPLESGDSNE